MHTLDPGRSDSPDKLAETLNRLDALKVRADAVHPGDRVVIRLPGTCRYESAVIEEARIADPHAFKPQWWLLHLRLSDGTLLGFTCAPGNLVCYRPSI